MAYSYLSLLQRLYWDLVDKNERKYYFYFLISQLPGAFGNMLRGHFISRHCKQAGERLMVLAGSRFRSIENLTVGDNVSFGNDNFIQALGGITIGNSLRTAPSVKIWSVNHNYLDKGQGIGQQGLIKKPVIIGDDVWLASNVFISPGVTLPDGVVVAAGSVVTVKPYKPYSILAGNPARVIGYRQRSDSNNESNIE